MKYKVIGWTYYDNNEVLDSKKTIGFAERNAIIDEIRKHHYLFSGWHHQESLEGVVPILNDGRKRCFSQRGWGGVMAEAYGKTNDYDYASYTFYESIDGSKLHFAKDDFNIDEYEIKDVENEHFKINVNQNIFDIAKYKNPFYLDDLKELRFIDENDTITLCCNDQELTFIVKDIDRNIASLNLNDSSRLINTKYKIIVTHKLEKEVNNVSKIKSKSEAFKMFKEAMTEYNYYVIKDIIDLFYIDYLTNELEKSLTKKSLTRFVKEYTDSIFKTSNVIQILKYLNNYNLYKEIAIKTFDKDKYIYVSFINHYLEKKKNMDEYILKYALSLKSIDKLYEGSINILYKAIMLKKDNKSLRKMYYKAIKNTRHEGLPIMLGLNLKNYLRKDDKCLMELDNYKSLSASSIMKVIEYLTYPTHNIKSEIYPYSLPKIYEKDDDIIKEGIEAYQKYIKEHFDIDNILEDIILCGIDKKCFNMDKYFRGEEYAANYICALDVLTNYKYNLKEKTLEKYSSKYLNFKEELLNVYK